MIEKLKSIVPGFILASVVGLLAQWVGTHYDAPVMLFALLFGIALSFLYQTEKFKDGTDFTSKAVLRFGIALLGLRIAGQDLMALGWGMAAVIVFGIASTILFGAFLSRVIGLHSKFGLLTGGSVAICGASAAMAISSVLPDYKDKEKETILCVLGVTALSTIVMVLYPILGTYLKLDDYNAGIFMGGSIHDVAQVVGAGYSVSQTAGDLATLTKMMRVTLLVPVVMCLIFYFQRTEKNTEGKAPKFPLFLIVFFAFMVLNSFVEIPELASQSVNMVSRFALVASIVAIGVKSNLAQLLKVGIKPVILMVAETIWLGAWVLFAILFFDMRG